MRDNHHLFKEATGISPINQTLYISTRTPYELGGALFIQPCGKISFKIIGMHNAKRNWTHHIIRDI